MKKNNTIIFYIFYFFFASAQASTDLVSQFPLNKYDQTISTWFNATNADYFTPLLNSTQQQRYFDNFIEHYVGTNSPWDGDYIKQIISSDIAGAEQSLLNFFSNANKSEDQIGYGENFQPYSPAWIENIARNINIPQFFHSVYDANQHGIAISNLNARALPTDDPHYYNANLPGQGYPFDNLQMSALWAGTPVYILGETTDHVWSLVVTPDYIGWVKSNGIAHVSIDFIKDWTYAARLKLMAITQTQTHILSKKGKYLFSAYVGAVFPADRSANSKILVPIADKNNKAVIEKVIVSAEKIAQMPLAATTQNFTQILQTLIGRPYGWGGIYFYNDCSAELKSLFTPFGIWLPRHSSEQVKIGHMVDMSASPKETRLNYLLANGHKFVTLIYIGGHVLLYVGNFPNPNNPNHSPIALSYQNIWGLKPNPPVRRAVIGKAVLLPLLLQYPEDNSLISLIDYKYFQVSYLDQFTNLNKIAPLKLQKVDVMSLMYPSFATLPR